MADKFPVPIKKALLPRLFASAIRAHQKLPLRSERHAHFVDLFVDHNQLNALNTSDWQTVYGRRGSGKTLLLGVLAETTNKSFDERRELAVSINMPDCIVSPVGAVATDDERALGYFQEFLRRLAEELVRKVDSALGEVTFWQRVTGQRKVVEDRIQGLAIELLQLSEDGGPTAAFARVTATRQEEETQATTAEDEYSLGLGANLVEKKISLSAHAKAGKSHTKTTLLKKHVDTVAVPTLKLASVGRTLGCLLEAMEVERLSIIIDEWQTIDPSGSTSIQPRFAELLKRTFFAEKRVTVKIAANRYQTALSNKAESTRHCGLELNAEIFEATNLDYAILDENDLAVFYAELIFKRLCFVEPQMAQFRAPDGSAPREGFVSSIFHDGRAYLEAVRGAQGVARDFLVLFNELAQRRNYSVEPLWNASFVADTIRELAVNGKIHAALTLQSEADQLLNKAIKTACARSNSRTILLKRDDRERFGPAVDELLEKRFLHDVPKVRLAPTLIDKYYAFIVDYGTWLEWQRERSAPSSDDATNVHPQVAVDPARFSVETSLVSTANLVRCTNCDQWFARDTKLFVKRGICPFCCEDVVPIAAISSGKSVHETDPPPSMHS
jgi:hypothetical protein